MTDFSLMNHLLYTGKAPELRKMIEEALAQGVSISEILERGLISGMNAVGDDFRNSLIYVPEVLIAARAMKAGMDALRTSLTQDTETALPTIGTIVIGTVSGDLHDIGKNLVAMMALGAGFHVIDLGVDVPAERFVQEAEVAKANIIAISSLLTTTMPNLEPVIQAVRKSPFPFKVVIGGAPITQQFANKIGADGYAPTAPDAADLFKRLIEKE